MVESFVCNRVTVADANGVNRAVLGAFQNGWAGLVCIDTNGRERVEVLTGSELEAQLFVRAWKKEARGALFIRSTPEIGPMLGLIDNNATQRASLGVGPDNSVNALVTDANCETRLMMDVHADGPAQLCLMDSETDGTIILRSAPQETPAFHVFVTDAEGNLQWSSESSE